MKFTLFKDWKFLTGLNYREKVSISLGLVILSIIFLVVYRLIPMRNQIRSLDKVIIEKKKEMATIKELSGMYKSLLEKENNIARRVLTRGNGFSALSSLEELANRIEVKKNLKSRKETSSKINEFYNESKVRLELEDMTMEMLTKYLHEIENSDNLFKVSNMHIRSQSTGLLNVSTDVSTAIPK